MFLFKFHAQIGLRFALFVQLIFLSGCGGLFLYPDKQNYFPDVDKYAVVQEGFFPTSDGLSLHYWFLPAQNDKVLNPHPKGLIIQVHGNAQNLSAHIRNVGWLTLAGYNLAIFDYRGYGKSTGSANLVGVNKDVASALDYFTQKLNPSNLPVCVYGQSLGGTLLLKTLSTNPGRWTPSLIVIESSFFSYTEIAQEKMAQSWLTWAFQWLPHVVLNDKLSLKAEELKTLSGIPKMLFYLEDDPIVPIHHGRDIYSRLPDPKEFYSVPERGHISTMWVQEGKLRDTLVAALNKMKPLKKEAE